MTRPTRPEDDHFFRVEVTVAAGIFKPDGYALENDVVDVTLGFNMSMSRPPEGLGDAEIFKALSHHLSPVLAAVSATLMQMGFASLGRVEEPMLDHSTATGEGMSTPVRVRLVSPPPGRDRPS